jgi:DNA-binding transcriptional regulator YhcF (GntR family)
VSDRRKRHSPGITVARRHIAEQIRLARQRGDTRIPAIRELSRAAGVSPRTMSTALSSVKREGILKGRRGSGLYVVGDRTPTPGLSRTSSPTLARYRWLTVATRLAQEVIAGAYSDGGQLPNVKELAHRYGISFRTMRKAMNSLVDRGMLRHERTTFSVQRSPSRRSGSARVVLITRGDAEGVPNLSLKRTADNLRVFEQECLRNGVHYEIVTWDPASDKLYASRAGQVTIDKVVEGGPVLGFIIWGNAIFDWSLPGIVDRCVGTGKRVVLFDEYGSVARRGGPAAMVVRSGFDESPGSDIATWLLRNRHRAVAYLSPLHDAPWSKARCEGLRKAFAAAGLPNGVSEFTSDDFDTLYGREDLYMRNVTQSESLLDKAIAQAGAVPAASVMRLVKDEIQPFVHHETIDALAKPLFEEALRDRSITCWVCASDEVAIPALRFLDRRHKSVPSEISVIGFDDSVDALHRGLTSYNFNGVGAVRAMLRHVLSGSPALEPGGTRSFDVNGYLVERRSTRAIT